MEMEVKPHQPCAACKMLRRRCDSKCLLAPYFPADELDKFAVVHRVFGASNVIKMIQMVEETKREDAVKAIVYEAMARVRDPVYGSAGAIKQLQKMVKQLKVEVETMKARVSEVREQRDELLMNIGHHADSLHHLPHHHQFPSNVVQDPVAVFDDYYAALSLDPIMDQFSLQGDWVL
ncbi:LOB domain-containing protein 25-like [Prosopis cineraria]|uniref:LOB domain-containing protein 25-like n=1 Tax=Prosopis cineraria TaxID=364024 RepID=UPI00240F5DF2|nr:LOB domain-containing protein 25-like [Prosopis cineraria]